MKSRIPKAMPPVVHKKRDGMDSAHLANIRQLPCLLTGLEGSAVQAHHLLRTEERGLSRKSSDRWVIPLSPAAHSALHAAGDEDWFLSLHGYDGRSIASALWAVRGDREAMRRVIFRARQAAALTVRTNA